MAQQTVETLRGMFPDASDDLLQTAVATYGWDIEQCLDYVLAASTKSLNLSSAAPSATGFGIVGQRSGDVLFTEAEDPKLHPVTCFSTPSSSESAYNVCSHNLGSFSKIGDDPAQSAAAPPLSLPIFEIPSSLAPSQIIPQSTPTIGVSSAVSVSEDDDDDLQLLIYLLSNVKEEFVVSTYRENSRDFRKSADHILSIIASTESVEDLNYLTKKLDACDENSDVLKVNTSADPVGRMWIDALITKVPSFPATGTLSAEETLAADEELARRLSQKFQDETNLQDVPRVEELATQEDFHYIMEMTQIDVQTRVQSDLHKCDLESEELKTTVSRTLLERFIKCLDGKASVSLCYHGTDSKNVASILELGLIAPGQDESKNVTMAHGSALGVGVYLARSPKEASRFCCGDGLNVIVCLALIGNTLVTTTDGGTLVINNPNEVLPVGLLRIQKPKITPCSSIFGASSLPFTFSTSHPAPVSPPHHPPVAHSTPPQPHPSLLFQLPPPSPPRPHPLFQLPPSPPPPPQRYEPVHSSWTPHYYGSETVHYGPRGGRYVINGHGNKVYLSQRRH
ncbi:hypothetical protein Pelo_1487 [Pelomyxa schiedti]|nr:hypothetical protein Pelo_1487 [Pelomyxa schiedti]